MSDEIDQIAKSEALNSLLLKQLDYEFDRLKRIDEKATRFLTFAGALSLYVSVTTGKVLQIAVPPILSFDWVVLIAFILQVVSLVCALYFVMESSLKVKDTLSLPTSSTFQSDFRYNDKEFSLEKISEVYTEGIDVLQKTNKASADYLKKAYYLLRSFLFFSLIIGVAIVYYTWTVVAVTRPHIH